VDVSLLSSGLWAMGQAIGLSLQTGHPWLAPPKGARTRVNPIAQDYRTKDDKTLCLTCLQAMKYWPELVDLLGHPELKDDARFTDNDTLLANGSAAIEILQGIFGAEDLAHWRKLLDSFTGQWAVAQDSLQIAEDPQVIANDYLLKSQTAEGHPFTIVGAPAQFGGEASPVGRAPDFNEHGDEILTEILGLEYEDVIALKVRGVVA
jgi:crotonobetainyl-CoA:carnitine CoA-transferase CaiB-like acyl-CoA transferase